MPKFHTTTEISDAQATGTQFATVQAETSQEAVAKVEQHLQDKGWTTGQTDAHPAR
ncbi:hypothetical protein ACFVYE_31960 [Streptomyces sp. NPDC058239]|uniref:hypothetical protein n=1 Tax=Streptomyces sp. NPDC058239 TaxID=3346395 RepID=UPI0036E3844B